MFVVSTQLLGIPSLRKPVGSWLKPGYYVRAPNFLSKIGNEVVDFKISRPGLRTGLREIYFYTGTRME